MNSSPSGVAMQLTFTEWGLPQMPIWIAHSETSFAKLQSSTGASLASPSSTKPGVVSQGQFTVHTTPPATTTNPRAIATPRTICRTDFDAMPAARDFALMVNLQGFLYTRSRLATTPGRPARWYRLRHAEVRQGAPP